MLVSKKKYDALRAENEALGERLVWMEILIQEHEKFSTTKRLQNKLDALNARYDAELKQAPRHSEPTVDEINRMNVDEWAREMKKAYPDNKFSWTD